MRYTAPSILTTKPASVAIQSGTDDSNKSAPFMDNAPISRPSTSAAYEADE